MFYVSYAFSTISKVHDALGMDQGQKNGYAIGKVKVKHIKYTSLSGGAAVSPETVRYFLSLDMKVSHHFNKILSNCHP